MLCLSDEVGAKTARKDGCLVESSGVSCVSSRSPLLLCWSPIYPFENRVLLQRCEMPWDDILDAKMAYPLETEIVLIHRVTVVSFTDCSCAPF